MCPAPSRCATWSLPPGHDEPELSPGGNYSTVIVPAMPTPPTSPWYLQK